MNILATLIAVAAWCGSPSQDWTPADVNQCRQEILACLDKTPKNRECFVRETLHK